MFSAKSGRDGKKFFISINVEGFQQKLHLTTKLLD